MKLSPTETRILQLICEGLESKQIAHRLHSNYWTILSLRRRIHEKTGLCKATQLVVYAIRQGIYDPFQSTLAAVSGPHNGRSGTPSETQPRRLWTSS